MKTYRISGARKSISKILAGSILGQGLLILISPVLTRLYSPEDFGALAILTSASVILASFVTLCWEMAIVLPERSEQARTIAILGFVSTIALSFIIAIVAFIWRDEFATMLETRVLAEFWWLIPVTVFAIGLYKVASSWFVRMEAYTRIAWRNVTQGVAQAVTSVGFGLMGFAPFGLISGVALGRIFALVGLLGKGSFVVGPLPPIMEFQKVAQRYKRFPLITTWSRTLNSIGLQLPILLLAAVYGSFAIGFLALTIRVLASPVSIVADAVGQYYEGAFGRLLRDGQKDLRRLTVRITSRLALIGLVPVVLTVLLAPAIFSLVFGSEWEVAGNYAQILVLVYYCQFVVAPISRTITLLERQGAQIFWDAGRAFLTCGVIGLAAILSLPIFWAIVMFAAAQIAAYAVLLAMSLTLTRARIASTA